MNFEAYVNFSPLSSVHPLVNSAPTAVRQNDTSYCIVFELKGPLKEASKFAQQLSGAVNEKVMGVERPNVPADVPDVGAGAAWEGAEAATAAAAAGGAAGVGMANGWKPPTSELGMDKEIELANDVPSELDAGSDTASALTIDEQVRLVGLPLLSVGLDLTQRRCFTTVRCLS